MTVVYLLFSQKVDNQTVVFFQNIMAFNKCSIQGKAYGDPIDCHGNPVDITDVRIVDMWGGRGSIDQLWKLLYVVSSTFNVSIVAMISTFLFVIFTFLFMIVTFLFVIFTFLFVIVTFLFEILTFFLDMFDNFLFMWYWIN